METNFFAKLIKGWDTLDLLDKKYIKLSWKVNTITFIVLVISVLLSDVLGFHGSKIPLYLTLLVNVNSFFLILKKKDQLGGVLMILALTGMCSYYSLADRISFFNEMMLVPVILGTLLFKDKKVSYTFFSLLFTLFLGLIFYNFYYLDFKFHNEPNLEKIYTLNLVIVVLGSFGIINEFIKGEKDYQKQIYEQQNRIHTLEMDAFEQEVDYLKKDIETLNFNNQLKLQYKENLIASLEKIKNTDDINKAVISLLYELKGEHATEEKIEVLHQDMRTVNTEFFERLTNKYPKISKSEREICALLKLNISTKEIASLRNITPNAVTVAKRRIRQKMGLDTNEALDAMIQCI